MVIPFDERTLSTTQKHSSTLLTAFLQKASYDVRKEIRQDDG